MVLRQSQSGNSKQKAISQIELEAQQAANAELGKGAATVDEGGTSRQHLQSQFYSLTTIAKPDGNRDLHLDSVGPAMPPPSLVAWDCVTKHCALLLDGRVNILVIMDGVLQTVASVEISCPPWMTAYSLWWGCGALYVCSVDGLKVIVPDGWAAYKFGPDLRRREANDPISGGSGLPGVAWRSDLVTVTVISSQQQVHYSIPIVRQITPL